MARHKDESRPSYEMRKEYIAVGAISFFSQAFFVGGQFSLENFRFLYTTIVLGQYTVPAMGPAFTNTVLFTICVTTAEVVISLMAGYALSRIQFTGRSVLQKLLLLLLV